MRTCQSIVKWEKKSGMGKILVRLRLHIREIAEKRSLTRTRLSRLADVNFRTLEALWDNKAKEIQLITMIKIAKVLKVPITDLYTVIDDENE